MKLRLLIASVALLAVGAVALSAAAKNEKGPDVAQVSQGEKINLADYAVPGKTTIFDFSSDYCGPCRTYTEPLAKLHAKRSDIAVVRVDINRPGVRGIDWKSPVAREFELESIPHFKVYGPDGKMIAEDTAEAGAPARQMVDKWIAELGQ
ncbi:MAG TPA: thioredoxin family protein [Candidatus Didemnitutus sp.]|nr:thioredoxin family protein [Candidatus Didemnitutus sp.]